MFKVTNKNTRLLLSSAGIYIWWLFKKIRKHHDWKTIGRELSGYGKNKCSFSHLSTKFLLPLITPQTSLEFIFQLILERGCSTITDTFNPLVLFSSQRTCFGVFPICFFRGNNPKVKHLTMLLLYPSGTFTKLIDVFIKIMIKEAVLYTSGLKYISEPCLSTNMNLSDLSGYGNIKAFRCYSSLKESSSPC